MALTMEREKRPIGRVIALLLIALLAAGVLTFGWWVWWQARAFDHPTQEAPPPATDNASTMG